MFCHAIRCFHVTQILHVTYNSANVQTRLPTCCVIFPQFFSVLIDLFIARELFFYLSLFQIICFSPQCSLRSWWSCKYLATCLRNLRPDCVWMIWRISTFHRRPIKDDTPYNWILMTTIHPPRDMATYQEQDCQIRFLQWKLLDLDSNFNAFWFLGSNWQCTIFGSDNGLAPSRR